MVRASNETAPRSCGSRGPVPGRFLREVPREARSVPNGRARRASAHPQGTAERFNGELPSEDEWLLLLDRKRKLRGRLASRSGRSSRRGKEGPAYAPPFCCPADP
jgi:hypothetical protein